MGDRHKFSLSQVYAICTYLVAQSPQTPNLSVVAISVCGWFGLVKAVNLRRYTVLIMGNESATIRNMMKATSRMRNAAKEM